MNIKLDWQGRVKGEDDIFPANVPGNIQADYGRAHDYGDLQYSDNFKKYKWMEDVAWVYSASFKKPALNGDKLYFVSLGIDYEYEIFLNGKSFLKDMGMYSKIEIDLTDFLKEDNLLEVEIYPVPKNPAVKNENRSQANNAFKPAVGYGWDWHPRLIVSGMWQDAYLQTRGKNHIHNCEVFYKLSEDLKSATVTFDIDCTASPMITLYSPEGEELYHGTDREIKLDDIELWWCNGLGDQKLYKWTAETDCHKTEGTIGFRKVQLVMNEGSWEEPSVFPKSRSNPPITVELNNKRIFAKGSNWVCPEIFIGEIADETFKTQIQYAKEANMNMFRVHGGTVVNRDKFFEYCDEFGIMVWQEFSLACNNYQPTEDYMYVVEKDVAAIVKRVRSHPSHVLWCGGNELFNRWSGMTDQSLALRLMNKICYEFDREKPFIMTSPLMGMAHGHYFFYDTDTDTDVIELMNGASNSAYTEFGCPSMAPIENLKKIIPQEEWFPMKKGTAWEEHFGFGAWGDEPWLCMETLHHYFGELSSVEEYVQCSNILECEGYKAVFGEARRQWPKCSMALNWDYNEPWMNAAGNNLLAYPAIRKPGYFAVSEILKPVVPTARFKCFDYLPGDDFSVEVYFHNDTFDAKEDTVTVYVEINGEKKKLFVWEAEAAAMANTKGPDGHIILPDVAEKTLFKVILETEKNGNMEYTLLLNPKPIDNNPDLMNM